VVLSAPQAAGVPQSPSPGRHWQAPPEQYCAPEHCVVQVPQWVGSTALSTQALPPPVVQTEPAAQVHTFATQLSPVPQRVPQVPQLRESVARLVQVVVPPPAGQSVFGAAHLHTPEMHVPVPQEWPHIPQFAGSLDVEVHLPVSGQMISPVGHMQTPPEQVPPAQPLPHAPQLFGSVLVSMHAPPLPPPAPHSLVPVGQAEQVPLTQVWPVAHLVLQLPQAAVLLERSAHTVPQLTWPVGHAQTPALQVELGGQAWPQVPQLFGSVWSPGEQVMPPPGEAHWVWPVPQVQTPPAQVPEPQE
jgi:hypothetical protein